MVTCDNAVVSYYGAPPRRRTDPGRVLAWMILGMIALVFLVMAVCFGPAIVAAAYTIWQDSQ